MSSLSHAQSRTCTPLAKPVLYQVKKGEWAGAIARKMTGQKPQSGYPTLTVLLVGRWNQYPNPPDTIEVGQTLQLPFLCQEELAPHQVKEFKKHWMVTKFGEMEREPAAAVVERRISSETEPMVTVMEESLAQPAVDMKQADNSVTTIPEEKFDDQRSFIQVRGDMNLYIWDVEGHVPEIKGRIVSQPSPGLELGYKMEFSRHFNGRVYAGVNGMKMAKDADGELLNKERATMAWYALALGGNNDSGGELEASAGIHEQLFYDPYDEELAALPTTFFGLKLGQRLWYRGRYDIALGVDGEVHQGPSTSHMDVRSGWGAGGWLRIRERWRRSSVELIGNAGYLSQDTSIHHFQRMNLTGGIQYSIQVGP